MPTRSDNSEQKLVVQVLRAATVEVPIVPPQPSAEIQALRKAFLAGKKLRPEDLRRLIDSSAAASNGNCWIC